MRSIAFIPSIPILSVLLCALASWPSLLAAEGTNAPSAKAISATPSSQVIEAAGFVVVARAGTNTWHNAPRGTRLAPGDRLRTGPDSRAAVLLSDRSVLRLGQFTSVQIQNTKGEVVKKRFRLDVGRLFFFDRETPSAIEFETPLTSGAIRGTEFVLTSDPQDGSTRLVLLDGEVELTSQTGLIRLQGGEKVEVRRDHPPEIVPIIHAISQVQWTLHYPAVLEPTELNLTSHDLQKLEPALEAYRRGNLIQALTLTPTNSTAFSPGATAFLAGLKLAVGNLEATESLLDNLPKGDPRRRALLTLISAVRGEPTPTDVEPTTASEWLASSYHRQSRSELAAARTAARRAAELAPDFGFAHARVAELELSFGHGSKALTALDLAAEHTPANPMVPTLRGFVYLDRSRQFEALRAFEEALTLDASLGLAWLGQGLAQSQLGRSADAEKAIQIAAALEPQRSVYRSALARTYANRRATDLARHELDLAQQLDESDPTTWLYRALLNHQVNRPNEAIADLEQSRALNDRRSVVRSRLLLDRDQAIRSANLAALYDDAGLSDVGHRAATRAVGEDYSGFAGHLFLANAYQQLEDPYRVELRYESARQSELLLANLLAPPGGGNLSQLISQQDHLRYTRQNPVALSTFTEYASRGDWIQSGSLFGSLGEFSYAVDTQYRDLQGDWENQDLKEFYVSAQAKDQLSLSDAVYVQVGWLGLEGGDTARHRTPEEVNSDLRFEERQQPFVYAGWNHEWSPGSHTLVLGAYLEDRMDLTDPSLSLPFVRMVGDQPVSITAAPLFAYENQSKYRLGSAELQQLWQTESRALVVGGRAQFGDVGTQATLSRTLTGSVADQQLQPGFSRLTGYAYHDWEVVDPLRVSVGLTYDRLTYPANVDLPPLSNAEDSREQWSPKVGFIWTPAARTEVRAAYAQALGGLYFDNSIRLEPTQVAGWNQTFRSLIPDSVVGQVPGSRFEILGGSLDQSFASGTYAGVFAEWLRSDGSRSVGVLTNSTFIPIPDSGSSTQQDLDYDERSAGLYAHQRLGNQVTLGVRYRYNESSLDSTLPALPSTLPGLTDFERDDTARLHHVDLAARWFHPCGAFAEWRSGYYHQTTEATDGSGPADQLWQHHLFIGYRFSQRRAELRLGILNLTDTDYRLDPLNLLPSLPRDRTFTASLRLNF